MTDFFAVLQLPVACEVDTALLERRYRELQGQWHPDRFADAEPAQKLAAMQKASLLNDAYATLKQPLSRAAHLLQLQGCDVASHKQSDLDPGFLLEQMQVRDMLETLEANGDEAGLLDLAGQSETGRKALWQDFSAAIGACDLDQARRQFHKLQFMVKLQDEIRAAEDRLLGY